MDDKRTRGLYGKFIVKRADGTHRPGEKHDGCEYFVLDLKHDPFAIPALAAYAEHCRDEYPQLAADLIAKISPTNPPRGLMKVDEIIEKLATAVMGWTAIVSNHQEPGETEARYWRNGNGDRHMSTWNPLKNPSDSKQLREKLAAQGFAWELEAPLQWTYGERMRVFRFWLYKDAKKKITAEAYTEELAVVKVALLTIGVTCD